MNRPSPFATKHPVLIIGSVAYDDIETPYATGERLLGGSATFASMAASYFSLPRLVATVGHDFDTKDIERLRLKGVNVDGLEINMNAPTFYWKGRYHENFNMRDTLITNLNAFEYFSPELTEEQSQTPFVLLGAISPELQIKVLEQLVVPKFVVADTITLFIETKPQELFELIRSIDLLVINDSEVLHLSDEKNIFLAAERIMQETGCPSIIVKKGEHGAILFHGEKRFAMPAYPVRQLHDPTGAGDAFAGALVGYLAAHDNASFETIKRAMLYATAAASLTVESFSCESLESANENMLQERVDRLLSMMSV